MAPSVVCLCSRTQQNNYNKQTISFQGSVVQKNSAQLNGTLETLIVWRSMENVIEGKKPGCQKLELKLNGKLVLCVAKNTTSIPAHFQEHLSCCSPQSCFRECMNSPIFAFIFRRCHCKPFHFTRYCWVFVTVDARGFDSLKGELKTKQGLGEGSKHRDEKLEMIPTHFSFSLPSFAFTASMLLPVGPT